MPVPDRTSPWDLADGLHIGAIMPSHAHTATASRPNRILIALASAWMILSLAIGGAVNADSSAQPGTAPAISADSTQD
ncbi:MAG: hypothetical protein H0W41_02970 [Chloroflexi bacterium]|nr:hypothetical protein [Chloroflexota bacterium]